MDTNPKTAIVRHRPALSRTKTEAGELLNNILTLADDKFKKPFEISINSSVITIGASEQRLLKSDGAGSTENAEKIAPAPSSSGYAAMALTTLNVASGAGTGDLESATPSIPVSIPASEYVWMGIEKRDNNKHYLVWGTPHATPGSATYPTFSFLSEYYHVAMILLQDDGTGSSGLNWNFVNPDIANLIAFDDGRVFEEGGSGGGVGTTCILSEKFEGDDSTVNFVLSYTPTSGKTPIVVVNGLVTRITTHWSLSVKTISFTTAPAIGSDILIIYATDSRLVQSEVTIADGVLKDFRTNKSLDMLGFINGLVNSPGEESRLSGNMIEFFDAPEDESVINIIGTGIGMQRQGVLSGTVDGTNVTFTLPFTPSVAESALVFLNGKFIPFGSGANKCTISGTTVTFGTAPVVGQVPYAITYYE